MTTATSSQQASLHTDSHSTNKSCACYRCFDHRNVVGKLSLKYTADIAGFSDKQHNAILRVKAIGTSTTEPVKVLSRTDGTEAVRVCEFGKHSNVVTVLKGHPCGHLTLGLQCKGRL